ncbi:lysophospholipid acyltransferase family protein [Coraliomargarita sp. SDUM461004]|uniref:Lysophospholipid acyltransferase family protein n=1 Tax=Thalassobacterium sedimentorum TaxID=3041258 RepID=A0ABU1AH25_9BACT|nr:lysophospholipid acyltransferase family protein [Coraliomargarita sp. SDUM461004]MDQ8193086.1 lysophospholipid acyltransferase family protein [Coraliomargarita sp. SDUM461004]
MIEELVCWFIKLFTGARAQWTVGFDQLQPGQRVYFANHSSHLDFLILWATLPPALRHHTRPVAARDYWARSRPRLWLSRKIFRAILIERKNISRCNNPIDQLKASLEQGDSLIIFPEGTRSSGDTIHNFKSGLYHLARHCPQAHFIPVYLENLNRVLPKGEFIPLPLICSVIFGAPLRDVSERSKDDFLNEAKKSLERLNPL